MKIRPSVFLFVAIITVLIALVLWPKKKTVPPSVATNPPQVSVVNQPIISAQPVNNNLQSSGQPGDVIKEYRQGLISKGQAMQEILATENDIPIVFYGRLEDQFKNPVSGAEVTGSTIIYNGTRAGSERASTISDANGFFKLDIGKGESLGIVPKKAGYVLATTSTFFKYSHLESNPYIPDIDNPTVIKMWQLQGAEPLFSINQRYKFYYTNAPINFDLLTGQIVPSGGDIQIMINRSLGIISGRTRQKWGVQVEAINGGLIESSGDEIVYEAPADGYQSNDSFIMSTNAPYKWFGGFDQTFFLQSRNGQVYSKVNFGISINQQPDGYIWVEFHGVANTNSSRNWEATAPN